MSTSDVRPTAISKVLTNKNLLLPVQSEFSIRRLPNVEFFCQRVWLPGINLPPVIQRNPFVDIPHSGDVPNFEEFEVTFLVDEFMINYSSVWDWIVKLGFPTSHEEYFSLSEKPRWSGEGLSSDCSLLILDSRGRARIEISFDDAHPVSISGFEVDSRKTDTDFVTATARFRYTKYTIERIR